jgi:fimbrial chaperone protein
MPMPRLLRQLLLGAAVAAVALPPAQAGNFAVTPVRLYMTEKDRAVALSVVNEGDKPVVLYAEFYRWTQRSNGSDDLQESDDLVLSPPVLNIAPHGRQVVRVARLRPADRSREQTYRVVIREIPVLSTDVEHPTLQVALAFSLPLFITPQGSRRALRCEGGGAAAAARWVVQCSNSGTAYAQLRSMKLLRAGAAVAQLEEPAYLLPGSTRRFELKPLAAGENAGPVQLQVAFDDNTTEIIDIAGSP